MILHLSGLQETWNGIGFMVIDRKKYHPIVQGMGEDGGKQGTGTQPDITKQQSKQKGWPHLPGIQVKEGEKERREENCPKSGIYSLKSGENDSPEYQLFHNGRQHNHPQNTTPDPKI